MMRLRLLITAIALLAQGQPVSASPEDDIAFIVDYVVTKDLIDPVRDQVAVAYTDLYADFLQEKKSIKILDRDRFAALLPEALTNNAVILLRKLAAKTCFRRDSVEQISETAEKVRQISAESKLPLGTITLKMPLQKSEIRTNDVGRVGVCTAFLIARLGEEIKASGEIPPLSHLADILEQENIASFPNRIVQRDVIAEFRNLDQ
jgi:hypothetical protein